MERNTVYEDPDIEYLLKRKG